MRCDREDIFLCGVAEKQIICYYLINRVEKRSLLKWGPLSTTKHAGINKICGSIKIILLVYFLVRHKGNLDSSDVIKFELV